MKADDDDDTPGFEAIVKGPAKRSFELFEFAVDGDPQGLKDARGRMTVPRESRATRRWSLPRRGRGDRVTQIAGRPDRLPGSPFDEPPRHAPGLRLFPIALEDVGQFLFAQAHDQLGGRFPLGCVESQVERPVRGKAEAPGVVGQLVGRQPEVEQNAVDRGDFEVRQDQREVGITGLMEVARGARELKGGNFQHPGIAVKTDQRPLWPDSPQNFATVPRCADRAIDHGQSRFQV